MYTYSLAICATGKKVDGTYYYAENVIARHDDLTMAEVDRMRQQKKPREKIVKDAHGQQWDMSNPMSPEPLI